MATTSISSSDFLGFNDNTGAVQLTSGTTAERPGSPSNGEMRYNTTDNKVEYYDGANWIQVADSSVPIAISADFLVVAGGGGSAGMATYDGGTGGAGAGGLRTSYGSNSGGGSIAESSLSLTTGRDYIVTVGGGGAATGSRTDDRSSGTGSNSVFSTITSDGGGYGGGMNAARNAQTGGAGGSGGGGGTRNQSSNGGAGTANQGYDGGASTGSYTGPGGGGAGAAGAGNNNNDAVGAQGGDGLVVLIAPFSLAVTTANVGQGVGGTNVWYSGGGAGSPYSSPYTAAPTSYGGGGQYTTGSGTPGTANTGGGAGGTARAGGTSGGSGGSGVVIVRYPNTRTMTVGAGLTVVHGTDGSDKIAIFKSGSDNISFS
jgi:hypothetical protein